MAANSNGNILHRSRKTFPLIQITAIRSMSGYNCIHLWIILEMRYIRDMLSATLKLYTLRGLAIY
jgi:hypothetical protein